MSILNLLLSPTLNFVKTNIRGIVAALAAILIFCFGFWVTTLSLKKLKVKVFAYYPFGQFFPQSGSWSVLYFLITIILLGVLIYFLSKGGFYLAPA
ncbi:MAG: hypothetical protein ABSC49_00990 [Candidatus Microgenomates bacterium]